MSEPTKEPLSALRAAFDALRSRSNDPGWSSTEVEVKVTKAAGYIPISQDLLDDHVRIDPFAEPTPEQRAELARQRAERQAQVDALKSRLGEITDGVAYAVLTLHAPDDHGKCQGDDDMGMESESPDWPCRTVETIAKHYGIELP